MDTKTMINQLKYEAEKHKNDSLFTGQTNITALCSDVIPKLEKLAEYETAEEEGRLVVLPCKVSDTVFVIENTHIEISEIYKIEIKHTAFEDRTYYLEKLAKRGMLYRYYNRDFGKTVFLTRKEAEKALKEIKKGEMTYQ